MMPSTKSRTTAPARSQAAADKLNLQSIQMLARELSATNEQLSDLRQAMSFPKVEVSVQDINEVCAGIAQAANTKSLKDSMSDMDRLFEQVFNRLMELENTYGLLHSKLEPVRAEEPDTCESAECLQRSNFRGARLTWSLNELQHRLGMLTERIQQTHNSLVI